MLQGLLKHYNWSILSAIYSRFPAGACYGFSQSVGVILVFAMPIEEIPPKTKISVQRANHDALPFYNYPTDRVDSTCRL
jgi:hypothetical protein